MSQCVLKGMPRTFTVPSLILADIIVTEKRHKIMTKSLEDKVTGARNEGRGHWVTKRAERIC